jgi:hypothetical protein
VPSHVAICSRTCRSEQDVIEVVDELLPADGPLIGAGEGLDEETDGQGCVLGAEKGPACGFSGSTLMAQKPWRPRGWGAIVPKLHGDTDNFRGPSDSTAGGQDVKARVDGDSQELCVVSHHQVGLQTNCGSQMDGVGAAEPAGQGRCIHQVRADKIHQADGSQNGVNDSAGQAATASSTVKLGVQQHRSHQMMALNGGRRKILS